MATRLGATNTADLPHEYAFPSVVMTMLWQAVQPDTTLQTRRSMNCVTRLAPHRLRPPILRTGDNMNGSEMG